MSASPLTGHAADERTRAREAYFLTMAEELVTSAPVPLMVTGGIVRHSVAQQVLDSGVALVGIGTALAADPNLPNQWKNGEETSPAIPRSRITNKALASAASMAWVRWQMGRLANSKNPQLWLDPRIPFLANVLAGVAALVPYNVEQRMRDLGASYSKARLPFMSYTRVDGRLVTGQNPGSAKATAAKTLDVLASLNR